MHIGQQCMVVGSQTCALHVRTACVMARHVLVSCAMVLVARSESTSSEGRRLHIQAVPVCSAHRTAGQGGGVPDCAPHEGAASVMGRHVLGCCAMMLLARLESTSSESRSCHTQSVPLRSAHRTAVQVVGSRDLALDCRGAPMPQWPVFRFYPCTSLECVRAFLDPRASAECSPV